MNDESVYILNIFKYRIRIQNSCTAFITAVGLLYFTLQLSEVQCVLRRSCGHSLVERVNQLCKSRGGHNYMDIQYRRKRSIISECCRNVCYDSQVHKYCFHQDPSDDGPVDYQQQDEIMAAEMTNLELINYQTTKLFASTSTTSTTRATTVRPPVARPEIGTIPPEYFRIPLFQYPTSRIIPF